MTTQRGRQIIRGLGGILPRSLEALRSAAEWSAMSPRGVRQLGEVVADEFTLTAMTLLAPVPVLARPLSDCAAAAEELAALGIDGAHGEPDPLQEKSIRWHRFGRLRYQRVTFEHDPKLPPSLQAERLGGPAQAAVHLYRHHDDIPRPWLVWVHGAGQGGGSDLLVARVQRLHRLGFNVALPIQPGHGVRRHAWPAYPGHDPLANVAGMMRAVSEVRAVVRWLTPQATSLAVAGISLGSPVAALVSHLERSVDAVAVYTPIAGLNSMVGDHLWRWGAAGETVGEALRSPTAAALMSVVDLLAAVPAPPPERRLIVAARHDRMAYPQTAEALQQRWGGRLYWHDGGHVGHIFSRQVQMQTERFLVESIGGRR
ncbi:alpha/beta hydrolase [[Mycobacterium] kokjensenii]|uniref:Alpha/beta hydrolase n=1 Tax=[Mycobacterium] kokjensenii TaxID=3064287 RepID=A0ABN9NAF0_9MYCO|nr:alpha/beta hydrolase [Mycolicibacter sp. MU0083]CAJ1503107.1 alpha/beta hydrolase [Mycolicibacter sp. MU0083]